MSRGAPRASILVPLYNSAATLRRCLASACAQTLRDIEIIVADDASTDDSASLAETIAASDPRIRVLRLPTNGGKPRAMNLMMAQATGDWVAVLDADDAYAPDRLERLIASAEQAGVDMAADNLLYIDAGAPPETNAAAPETFGRALRTAFAAGPPDRIIGRADIARDADSYGEFDYGILKPVISRRFVQTRQLAYYENSRLAEDFTYLLEYMVAGGRTVLNSTPMYLWTMPFGTVSRQWTTTGAGAWRYDYRGAILANTHFIARMREAGHPDIVEMLERRGRQYRVMVHYIAAQRCAAEGRRSIAALTLLRHPSTWGLLARRVAGRARRLLATSSQDPAAQTPASQSPASQSRVAA